MNGRCEGTREGIKHVPCLTLALSFNPQHYSLIPVVGVAWCTRKKYIYTTRICTRAAAHCAFGIPLWWWWWYARHTFLGLFFSDAPHRLQKDHDRQHGENKRKRETETEREWRTPEKSEAKYPGWGLVDSEITGACFTGTILCNPFLARLLHFQRCFVELPNLGDTTGGRWNARSQNQTERQTVRLTKRKGVMWL